MSTEALLSYQAECKKRGLAPTDTIVKNQHDTDETKSISRYAQPIKGK